MKSKIIKQLSKTIIFLPLLLYCGPRSYIAYDEGFYALQAKWMLQTNNWIIPTWWDEYTLDRTNGIQFLIAKSQKIFGESAFAAHLPSTLAAGLMLLITYKLHQELISKKDALFSTLILATTYIWLDFAHLATQDIIFACLITSGIYSLTKFSQEKNSFYLFIAGAWIGLAFMMKTFLVAIPLLALCPYLLHKREILNTKFFWLGLLSGFFPFLLWSVSINQYIDKNIIFFLIDKFNTLSKNNTFTNPFFYYLWNIPVNFLPWSIFSLIGLVYQLKYCKKVSYLLVYFPIIFVLILSLFSTKTPYYVLPISSIISINAYLGLQQLLKMEKLKLLIFYLSTKIIPSSIIFTICFYFFRSKKSLFLNVQEELILLIGLILFALMIVSTKKAKNPKFIIISCLISPYLISTYIVQSGLLSDRSLHLRENIEYISMKEDLKNTPINVIKYDTSVKNSTSKLIKISLLTPNLGSMIKDLNDLKTSELAWIIIPTDSSINKEQYEIVSESESLNPWKLIKKI